MTACPLGEGLIEGGRGRGGGGGLRTVNIDDCQGTQGNARHAGELASDQLHNVFYLLVAFCKIFLPWVR